MSKAVLALLTIAVLISVGQWAWTRLVAVVDPALLPAHWRRHVQWVQHNSTHIQLMAATLAGAAVAAQVAVAVS